MDRLLGRLPGGWRRGRRESCDFSAPRDIPRGLETVEPERGRVILAHGEVTGQLADGHARADTQRAAVLVKEISHSAISPSHWRAATVGLARISLLRRSFLERILHRWEGFEFDRPRIAADLLDFANIDVLHDIAGSRVDRDRSARAFPLHTLHGADHGFGVGIAVGLFQRSID